MTQLQGVRAVATIALVVGLVALGVAAVAAIPAVQERGRVQESCRAIRAFIVSDVALRQRDARFVPVAERKLNRAFADRWRVYAGGITCAH